MIELFLTDVFFIKIILQTLISYIPVNIIHAFWERTVMCIFMVCKTSERNKREREEEEGV